MAYYVPPRLNKWGDTSPVSPSKLRPCRSANEKHSAGRLDKKIFHLFRNIWLFWRQLAHAISRPVIRGGAEGAKPP